MSKLNYISNFEIFDIRINYTFSTPLVFRNCQGEQLHQVGYVGAHDVHVSWSKTYILILNRKSVTNLGHLLTST